MKIQKKTVRRMYVAADDAGSQEKWLCDILNRSGINCSELARRCRVTKQTISFLIQGRTHLTFPMVIAICYATGFQDDPEEVWNAVSL